MAHIRPGFLSPSAAELISQTVEQTEQNRDALQRAAQQYDDWFPAQLTSESSGKYAWKRRAFAADGTRYDHPSGQTGTTTIGYAQTPNGETIADLPFECWLKRKLVTTTAGAIYEVVSGGSTGAKKAAFIRFTLPSALATTDASKASCTVDDYWGGGNPGSTVTVYNLPASSNYVFSGASGNKGVATYDDVDDKYWILQLECP